MVLVTASPLLLLWKVAEKLNMAFWKVFPNRSVLIALKAMEIMDAMEVGISIAGITLELT